MGGAKGRRGLAGVRENAPGQRSRAAPLQDLRLQSVPSFVHLPVPDDACPTQLTKLTADTSFTIAQGRELTLPDVRALKIAGKPLHSHGAETHA